MGDFALAVCSDGTIWKLEFLGYYSKLVWKQLTNIPQEGEDQP